MAVSCRIWYNVVSYLFVGCSRSITSVGGERESCYDTDYITCVSVWRGFLFLLVLRIVCVISSWHSLCLPYDFFLYKNYSYIVNDLND